MDEWIIKQLSAVTPEEQKILDGQPSIDRQLYMQGFENVINSKKLLSAGKLITIRPHTRFVHFPEHTHDYVEQIIQAAKLSHAHNFIKRLPNGYDTVIGETGHNLSQGQMQLLCIARVMLALPPMLFLDEATSSIDTRTELRVQKAFETLMKGRTSFIVAHRLSTVQEADLILVMKDGNVIESGTHNGLIAQKGFYATLYESQFAH